MIVPQANFAAENWNEGTPFRRLGLHTHRKAPAEAQTRFSEEILQRFYRIGSICSTATLQAGLKITRRTLSI